MNYTDFKAQQEAIAAQWIADHANDLPECNEQSHASIQGYEVQLTYQVEQQDLLDAVLDEIVEEEADNAEVWEFADSGDDYLTEGGKFNVVPLAHWKKAQEFDQSHKPVGTRFDGIKYKAHQKGAIKYRAHYCIEDCFNSHGTVVKRETFQSRTTPEAKKAVKSKRIMMALVKLDRS